MRLLYFLFLSSFLSFGQSQIDTLKSNQKKNHKLLKRSIIPISFIGIGIALNESDIEKTIKANIRNQVGDDFEFRIDDYLQFAPIAEMYIADGFGVPAKNHWFDQTKYLLMSNILTSGITVGLKVLINKPRPNGGIHSLPSGHTSSAFTNATVLFNEFNETAPLLAYSGYTFSTATGIFRMVNNKHWVSDVLIGAGIGIIATELIYHFEPLKKWNPFKKTNNVTFSPSINQDGYGFYFSLKL